MFAAGMFRNLSDKEENLKRDDTEISGRLIEHISDMVTVLTADGNVKYESSSVQQVLGYKPQDLIGKNIFRYIHPDDRERIERIFRKRLDIKGFSPAIIFRFLHKNGTWRYLEAVNNNLMDDQSIAGFVVTSKDITERRLSEEKLRELDDLKNTFIRVVSHQLRSPLNAIRWNLELVLAGQVGEVAPRQRGLMRVSYDANTEIIRRIDDLLIAMDIEEGRFSVKPEACDMTDMVQSAIAELRKRAEMKRVRIAFVPPKRRTIVDCDFEKTRSAVHRILENAIQYSHDRGRVDVKLSAHGGWMRFSVSDQGVGVPLAEKRHLFTRFYRATNASVMQTDSSGLGLYIAKFFIEQQGGTVGFTSREGKGSVFWFDLPLNP